MHREVVLAVEPLVYRDVVADRLQALGYDSFRETEHGLNAYVDDERFDRAALEQQLAELRALCRIELSETATLPEVNWNKAWEANFESIYVADKAVVRAPFHDLGDRDLPALDLLIQPKMSFGTGHHATTYLMLAAMCDLDFTERTVLDFGSGTAILAIAAEKLGAASVLAIDNDEWAYRNSLENLALNGCSTIESIEGDHRDFIGKQFQTILANINRQVLLATMPDLAKALETGGDLLLSGLLEADEARILARAVECGFSHRKTSKRNGWLCLHFTH